MIIMTEKVPYESSATGAYYDSFLQRLPRNMHKVRAQMLVTRAITFRGIAQSHVANVINKKPCLESTTTSSLRPRPEINRL